MEIKSTLKEKKLILSLSGEIDLHHATKLRTVLLSEIKKKPGKLVLDFKEVSFIDSSGIATLVEALKESKNYSLDFILCCLGERVKDVFELSRLDKVFKIVQSSDEA